MSSTKVILLKLCILLLLYDHATSLIIPEELPTILSLIYSNIPPIKKGTDSRVGLGFRLGQHADFQMLVELGPQTETDPIGNADSKRRRDAMLTAAMRGELGPLAQAVAKYQMERKLQKELERLKKMDEKLKGITVPENNDKKNAASEWLTKWSKDVNKSAEDRASLEDVEENLSISMKNENTQRIRQPSKADHRKGTIEDLTKLYKVQSEEKTE